MFLQCRGDLTKTYSLEAYDNWFNCLSMLVATEVCRVSAAWPLWVGWHCYFSEPMGLPEALTSVSLR